MLPVESVVSQGCKQSHLVLNSCTEASMQSQQLLAISGEALMENNCLRVVL
jgi:hypothetical protein